MWMSCITTTQTGWPAGSSSHLCYLRNKSNSGGFRFRSAQGSPTPRPLCLYCNRFRFFFLQFCSFHCCSVAVFPKQKHLNVIESHILSCLLNTHFLVFQKLRRKKHVSGCGQQDFPSMLSSLKVIRAITEQLLHLSHRSNMLFGWKIDINANVPKNTFLLSIECTLLNQSL